jgi:uncharacterized membrane protein
MKKSRRIAYIATFIALIFIALLLDTAVGSVLPVKPAIFSLPTVFTFALMFGGFWYAVLGGTVFGLLSFARAFITGSIPFQNPLIAILPRIIIGLVIYGLYYLGRKIFAKSKKSEMFAIGFASLISVFLHTLIVMTAMFAFDFSDFKGIFMAIISFNFPIELVVTTVLTPFLVLGVRRGLKIKIDEKIKKTDEAESLNGENE